MRATIALLTVLAASGAARAGDVGRSVLTRRLDDPGAVYVERGAFGARGDGAADDASALQKAIDTLQETYGQGVVFLAGGRYRVGRTIDLWKGIRLVGWGPKRPVLVMPGRAPNSGGEAPRYMIHFRDARRPDGKLVDARNTTFASGLINVNLEVQPGSGAQAAVRYHVAQLCTIRDLDFRLPDDVEAGVHAIGNEIVRCRFFGGRHAISTGSTSAGWQSLVMDCLFEGQRVAAIRTGGSGLTVLGCAFRSVPEGIVIPPKHIERLYVESTRFEGVPGGAVVCEPDTRTANQINLAGVVCRDVPRLLRFRGGEAAPEVPGGAYVVRSLSHGLLVESVASGAKPRRGLIADVAPLDALPPAPASWLPPLPPAEQWVNVRGLGAAGDGKRDDTAALKKAVAEHRVLYFPAGSYLLSDTLELGSDTVLIGLHPRAVQLRLAADASGFADPAAPKPVLLAPRGGRNLVMGMSFEPGANPGAGGVKWLSGPRSCLDDAYFPYGRSRAAGEGTTGYGLWVADGGGGTFKNIWAPNNAARCGLYVSNTAAPGRAILCSIEHHRDVEVVLEGVRNWAFHALQTEAESSGWSTAVEMKDCADLLFANLYAYRTSRSRKPHPHAVRAAGCRDILFRGVHNFSLSRFPYTHTLLDADTGAAVAHREAAYVALRPE